VGEFRSVTKAKGSLLMSSSSSDLQDCSHSCEVGRSKHQIQVSRVRTSQGGRNST
jgi:hypothetical protein